MIYDLSKLKDCNDARFKLEYFISKDRLVEIKTKNVRSSNQNSYLHLILSAFAIEYGDTIDYVKEAIFKELVNKDIFVFERINRVTGEVRKDLKSTRDLSTSEMTIAINRFRDYSSREFGLYLADPNEKEILNSYLIESEKMKAYL